MFIIINKPTEYAENPKQSRLILKLITMINYTISGEGINAIDCFSIKDVRNSIIENVNGCLDLLIKDYLIIYKEGKTMFKIGTIYIDECNKIKLEYHTHYKKDANGDIGN